MQIFTVKLWFSKVRLTAREIGRNDDNIPRPFHKKKVLRSTLIHTVNNCRSLAIFDEMFQFILHRQCSESNFWCKLPVGIYMFKVNNRNTRKRCEICSKLTIKTPFSSVSIVNFEQVNADWDRSMWFCQSMLNHLFKSMLLHERFSLVYLSSYSIQVNSFQVNFDCFQHDFQHGLQKLSEVAISSCWLF